MNILMFKGTEQTKPPHAGPECSWKILVIDDSAICREPLLAGLRLKGLDAHGASSGEAGLAIIRSQVPDLVVLDVMMPEMDGWSVLRILRRNPTFESLPVILLTATVDKLCVTRAKDLGVREYVLKEHFSIDHLYERIQRVLNQRKPNSTQDAAKIRVDSLNQAITTAVTLKKAVRDLAAVLRDNPKMISDLLEEVGAQEVALAGGASSAPQSGDVSWPDAVALNAIRNIASIATAA